MGTSGDPKKARERLCLERVRAAYPDFPGGRVEEAERPDFLVHAPDRDRPIGVEIREYVRRHGLAGNFTQPQREDFWWGVARAARAEYESRGGPPVSVIFWWNDFAGKGPPIPVLGAAAARLVAARLPAEPGGKVRLDWEDLRGTPLRDAVSVLWVDRLPERAASLWGPAMGGAIGADPAEIQGILDEKDGKVEAYRRSCGEVWLLIVALGGLSIARTVSPDEGAIVGHVFRSRFDRVLFSWDEAVLSLRIAPPPGGTGPAGGAEVSRGGEDGAE